MPPNNLLSRQIPAVQNIQRENVTIPEAPDYQVGDYDVNFYTNLRNVLGETLWGAYEKTNTITGGALDKAVNDAYFNISVGSGDYGLQFEKNAYIDDLKQDYKLTLSKRF